MTCNYNGITFFTYKHIYIHFKWSEQDGEVSKIPAKENQFAELALQQK